MDNLKWYMAICSGEAENVYETFPTDTDAIMGFMLYMADEPEEVLEIYKCANDENLTPIRKIYG